MGLETRGNGLYLYTKKRIGNRVFSEYVAGGPLAQLLYDLDRIERQKANDEKEASRRTFVAEKQRFAEVDQVIETFCQEAHAIEEALYLITGYHEHSRQWRKKRNENDQTC